MPIATIQYFYALNFLTL